MPKPIRSPSCSRRTASLFGRATNSMSTRTWLPWRRTHGAARNVPAYMRYSERSISHGSEPSPKSRRATSRQIRTMISPSTRPNSVQKKLSSFSKRASTPAIGPVLGRLFLHEVAAKLRRALRADLVDHGPAGFSRLLGVALLVGGREADCLDAGFLLLLALRFDQRHVGGAGLDLERQVEQQLAL